MVLFHPLVGVCRWLLKVLPVVSQVASPSWNSTITRSLPERVSLAGAALDVAIDRLDADGIFDNDEYGTGGALYSQMAAFDIATNQTKYQNKLEQYFNLQATTRVNFSTPSSSTDDGLLYGYASMKAYSAYKNPVFLQYAIASWWLGRSRTLSQSDVSDGRIATKSFTITKACQNATMAGGTFWEPTPGESSISGIATGDFLVLSSLLAEATSDSLYLKAANDSANFIHSHLFNIQNIVQDYIFTDTSRDDACQVQTATGPSSSGSMIEGLSVLLSITNDSWTQKLLDDLLVAVIPNTEWQGVDGIVSAEGKFGDRNLLQGLGSVYARKSANSTLRQYVGEYIAVQFNAVTNLATAGDTNIYGISWTGPPSANFTGINQTTSLAALVSAIGLETDSSVFTPLSTGVRTAFSSSSASPTSSTSPSLTSRHKNSPKLAAVLGGTLGGLAILLLLLAILWLLRRKPHHTQTEPFLTSSPFAWEKRGIDGNLSQLSARIAPEEGTSSQIVSTNITDHGNVESVSAAVFPTEQLVQLLNHRLQHRRWDEGETPPNYTIAPV